MNNSVWSPDIPDEYKNQIVTGDARELSKRLPDSSIDLILCDPIFNRPDDYLWLAMIGERVLKPGGNLIAETAHEYLPEIINNLSSYLDYVWLLIERNTGGTAQIWKKKIMVFYQPYLWFSKGPRKGRWIYDARFGRPDKKHHVYGDGELMMMDIIERLTEPNDIVLDPFVGGGTVPAICKMLGRNYIAFEIEPGTADLARQRVINTQPPLFILEPQQYELLDEQD